MRSRDISLLVLIGLFLALASAAPARASAPAQCGPQKQDACEPPKAAEKEEEKEKKPTATDLPTKVPTETAVPVSQMQAKSTPDAAELAILCANLSAGGNSDAGVDLSNPAPEVLPPVTPAAPPISPLVLGGGGLMTGILIGMLLPAVSRAFSGGARGSLGGIIAIDDAGGAGGVVTPTDYKLDPASSSASDAFHKEQDAASAEVFPKVESAATGDGFATPTDGHSYKTGDAFIKGESSNPFIKGEGSSQFMKGESSDPFIKGESSGDLDFHR